MKQRICIARALLCNPALILADEPTTNLDVTIQAQILDLLEELRERLHMAMLLVSHDMGLVARMADRITVVYAGRTCETADARTIFHAPLHPYTRALLDSAPRVDHDYEHEARPVLRTIGGRIPRSRRAARWLPLSSALPGSDGRVRAAAPGTVPGGTWTYRQLPEARQPSGSRMTRAGARAASGETLSGARRGILGGRTVGQINAVDDVSFNVSAGEALALVGESGCGKTTTARSMLHLVAATSGEVWFDGKDVLPVLRGNDRAAMLRVRRGMQYHVPGSVPLAQSALDDWPDTCASRSACIGMFRRRTGTGPHRRVAGDVLGWSRAHAWRYPHEFSGGQRQRVGVARALAVEPRLPGAGRTGVVAGCVGARADPQSAGGAARDAWV